MTGSLATAGNGGSTAMGVGLGIPTMPGIVAMPGIIIPMPGIPKSMPGICRRLRMLAEADRFGNAATISISCKIDKGKGFFK